MNMSHVALREYKLHFFHLKYRHLFRTRKASLQAQMPHYK